MSFSAVVSSNLWETEIKTRLRFSETGNFEILCKMPVCRKFDLKFVKKVHESFGTKQIIRMVYPYRWVTMNNKSMQCYDFVQKSND